MPSQTWSTRGNYTWTAPSGVHTVQVECWGGGGVGGIGYQTGYPASNGGGGGGGGGYAKRNAYAVTPGNTYNIVVGSPFTASNSTFDGTGCVGVLGAGGGNGTATAVGIGGAGGGGIGDVVITGQNGYDNAGTGGSCLGPGGGAGGSGANWYNVTGPPWSWSENPGRPGVAPGGGGGGDDGTGGGYGVGADGQVTLTWINPIIGTIASQTSSSSYGAGGQTFLGSTASRTSARTLASGSEIFSGAIGSRTSTQASGSGDTLSVTSGQISSFAYVSTSGTGTYTPLAISGTITSYASVSTIGAGVVTNLGYYLSLFTSEYRQSPNMQAWALANLQLLQDVWNCIEQFATAQDLDLAVGVQLDILGSIIGQPRTVGFQPSGGVSPILDDATYRLLLKARVYQNHWNGTIDELLKIWQALFPGGTLIVQDNQNMTVNIFVAGSFTSIIQDLITNGYIVPRPQAVLYAISIATLPMLGFDRNDAYVAGFDAGKFV